MRSKIANEPITSIFSSKKGRVILIFIKKIWNTIKRLKWWSGLHWLFWLILGAVLPVVIQFIVNLYHKEYPLWTSYISHGEFFIYSLAILLPTIPVLIREKNFPIYQVLLVVDIIAIMADLIFYMASLGGSSIPLFVIYASLGILILTFIVAFFANLFSLDADSFREAEKTNSEKLTRDFEQRIKEGI